MSYDLYSRQVVRAEVLLHWQEETGALRTASDPISIAEETNPTALTGQWIIRRALEDFCRWRTQDEDCLTSGFRLP
ncbi:MAG: hypothetical protein FD153_1803 [Rhodospirillaceae bacterium]|nr:MAG: hypothetical protein FD153_1803 [Rhodospirillaceae bacterium]